MYIISNGELSRPPSSGTRGDDGFANQNLDFQFWFMCSFSTKKYRASSSPAGRQRRSLKGESVFPFNQQNHRAGADGGFSAGA